MPLFAVGSSDEGVVTDLWGLLVVRHGRSASVTMNGDMLTVTRDPASSEPTEALTVRGVYTLAAADTRLMIHDPMHVESAPETVPTTLPATSPAAPAQPAVPAASPAAPAPSAPPSPPAGDQPADKPGSAPADNPSDKPAGAGGGQPKSVAHRFERPARQESHP